MSKNVIILLVTSRHVPPQLQTKGVARFRISVQEERDTGILVAAKPQASSGREGALDLEHSELWAQRGGGG